MRQICDKLLCLHKKTLATVKVYLKDDKNKKNESPLLVQITHNYRRRYKTLFSVKKEFWNDKRCQVRPTHPFHIHLNQAIDSELSKYRERIYKLEAKGLDYNVDDIMAEGSKTLLRAIENYMDHAKRNISLCAYDQYSALYNKVNDFKKSDPALTSVDRRWMEEFATFLKSDPNITAENTVNKYLAKVKRVLRYEDIVTDALKVSSSYKKKPKVSLTWPEFEKLRDVELPDDWNGLARDTFVLQVYLRGARIADMLQLTHDHIHGGRIIYTTMKNSVDFDVKILPEMSEIIEKYKGQSRHNYLLPILKKKPADPHEDNKFRKHIESRTVLVNRYIKQAAKKAGIKKHITTHIARHSFARFCNDKGLDLKTIQNLFGHSSPSITENYMQDVRQAKELDDAVDSIF